MNRSEIEKEALSLPAAEREVLLNALHASLEGEDGLTPTERAEMKRLRAKFEVQVEAGFASGEDRV